MKFKATINVMPHEALLDPQGKAVGASLLNNGLSEIANVRIGKHIHLEVNAVNKEAASEKIEEACKLIFVNQIMEGYTYDLKEI